MKLKLSKENKLDTKHEVASDAVTEDIKDTIVPKKKDSDDMEANLEELMQKQVDHEFENARLYLAMALWCSQEGYIETAKFFSEHALEERKHGMDFINTMLILNMKLRQPITPEMKGEYDDLGDLLQDAVDREIMTSIMIGRIYKCSMAQGSLVTRLAEEYVEEQLEEEQLFKSILNLYKLHETKDSLAGFESQVGTIAQRTGKYSIGTLADGLHI